MPVSSHKQDTSGFVCCELVYLVRLEERRRIVPRDERLSGIRLIMANDDDDNDDDGDGDDGNDGDAN